MCVPFVRTLIGGVLASRTETIVASSMSRFGHNARIMSARGQEKTDLGASQSVQLIYRTPGRYMVAFGAYQENQEIEIGERYRPSVDAVPALGKVVAQVQMLETFGWWLTGRRWRAAWTLRTCLC